MKLLSRARRVIFSRKMLGRVLFGVACLVTLLVLFILEENWRAKRDWAAFVKEHEARGDALDFTHLIPPPVPDGQNFAMTPLLRPLFPDEKGEYQKQLQEKLELPKGDAKIGTLAPAKLTHIADWKKNFSGEEVLDGLQKYDPDLREISEAVRRPCSRFPIDYEKGFEARTPHGVTLMKFSKLFQLRAIAELKAGQDQAAFADTQTIFLLADALKGEPLLISQLVRLAIWQQGLQAVWEGLEQHRWTGTQLQDLQAIMGRVDFLEGIEMAFHGERAGCNSFMLAAIKNPGMFNIISGLNNEEQSPLFKFIPSAWIYRNLLEINRYDEKYLFPSVDVNSRRIDLALIREGEQYLNTMRGGAIFGRWVPNPYKVLCAVVIPAVNGVFAKTSYIQTTTDQAVIACALERYHLENGSYPDALQKLIPEYLKSLPLDVVNGDPPRYRLNADGAYLLYSFGYDGKDDGGKMYTRTGNSNVDTTKGDWTWAVKSLIQR